MNQSFAVKQADTMDRRVGRGRYFEVPSGSLALFNMATMSLWSASYDRWVAPALRRHTGNPHGLTMKQRVGGGLLLATASTAIEFFYTELPKSMASFSMSLLYMAFGVGNLAGALIVKVVQAASGRGGKTSWLVDDLNAGHYDYYYWLLTGYGVVNFVYFAWCSWVYGEEGKNVEWEEDDDREQPPML
ncbi:protein NRT1/ PTR FAMILY 1.2-like [Panicum virgatum]|uniref:protein NRT1/ PTR FAMILY 1.2-like n=1 Tax=Panicum virgatum TaxID=38727 RepID=UPI0019D5D73E|nr:protein NRT1/ PTR FAMILY 1.2-like [Panicum virgatum]